MANRPRLVPTLIAAALMAICLPLIASAQGTYGPWGRNRDRDYRRDRDYGSYGRYGNRNLRDVARRLDDRSGDFQRHLDSSLDRSRYDDTRREDNINELARRFRDAASRFRDRVDDRDGGSNEARNLLQIGSRMDNLMARLRVDGRTQSDWSRIRQDLRIVADAYGLGYGGGYGGYGNGGYYGRDDDYYGNDRDRYRRRRNTNNDWWRRLPLPLNGN
ncbi:MAG TPA: hypothetical protein VD861_13595 [Pyrinomonadaceae bacterium]|nr:hypothetical protein [Pyrinomonadaceae bacterium]